MSLSSRLSFVRSIHVFNLAVLLNIMTHLSAQEDPFQWMEEVENEKALAWAKEQSDEATSTFEAVPEFETIHEKVQEIYNSQDRIPSPVIRDQWIYNFWQDETHVRGIWRRTSLDEYMKEDPNWETVLDIDALAEAEEENWVWDGASFLEPEYRLCMIGLSRGGADAAVEREFDVVTKAFVEGGFFVPESKANVSWKDENTLWIGTDFGEGSLTDSGYPRIAKEWKRGKPLESAKTVFEGEAADVSISAYSSFSPEGRYDIVHVSPAFFRGRDYFVLDDRLVKLEIPEDARFNGFFKEQMLLTLRSDWTLAETTYPQGALLSIDLDQFLQGNRAFDILFEPEERVTLDDVSATANYLLYSTLDNVRGKLYRLSMDDDGWSRGEIQLPGIGTVNIGSTSDSTDDFFFSYTDFLTPSSLYLVRSNEAPKQIKSSPAWFDTEGMKVVQNEAISKDGTRIPYFLFTPKGFKTDGKSPTLISAYGGFEISRLAQYSGTTGTAWVERGGVYVLANIRGGGEFGPKWHQAALREKRQTNFDDLIAVAEDLVKRKITSPEHLGIQGGSQGGLLVGGALTQRPDLFNAVVCAVPLLDMKRYNKLLAGASWMAEYGNPDTDDWNYIQTWSPYHNLDANQEYPKAFFWTNTRDDRVHPAHARKMVARMEAMNKPVFYYENTEGGHGGGANLKQRAYIAALSYAYLWKMLK